LSVHRRGVLPPILEDTKFLAENSLLDIGLPDFLEDRDLLLPQRNDALVYVLRLTIVDIVHVLAWGSEGRKDIDVLMT